jgi:hypothetical protein
MVAPSMVADAEDHIARILDLVADRAGVDGVVASNVTVVDGASRAAALHRGVIDALRLAKIYRRRVPEATFVVVADEERDEQRRALAMCDG